MRTGFSAFVIVVMLSGCASESGRLWNSTSNQDEFTDEVTRMVTVGEFKSNTSIFTKSFSYYPFVGVLRGEVIVGVRSGGRVRIPTGTVQLRVDNNTAWTISPQETPLVMAPPMAVKMPTTSRAEDMMKFQEQAIRNAAKFSSPFTVATGDKAKSILREMIEGKVIKYRIVGMNQAGSSTGEVQLDDSFELSLREIGINPNQL